MHNSQSEAPMPPGAGPSVMPTDWACSPSTVETHISVLMLVGDRAYKLHKPLKNAFLDHSTRQKRHQACQEEVSLNRRFAPDVYLGVVDLTSDDGTPRDHLVAMKRLPGERQLTRLLDDPEASRQLTRVAQIVADAHRAGPPIREEGMGDWRQLRQLWQDGATQMSRFTGSVVPASQLAEVSRLARRFIAGRHALFDLRIAQGRVRDGHGDLLTDDIYCMPDGPRILDCLAFDRALRVSDTLSDAAFLAMDITSHGGGALGDEFLEDYASASDDRFPPSHAYHYLAYRAFVRSKIACLAAEQGRAGKADRAAQLLQLAESYLQRGRVRMVLVGGPPGTGKSTLASHVAEECGFAVVRSDVTRKHMSGIAPSTATNADFGAGIYTPEATQRVHSLMLDQAGALMRRGYSVVLDASWSDTRHRPVARRIASECQADLTEIRCDVSPAEADRRILKRRQAGTDASDATAAIAKRMRASFDPWPEARVVDTAIPQEDCAKIVASELGLEVPQPQWIGRADPAEVAASLSTSG